VTLRRGIWNIFYEKVKGGDALKEEGVFIIQTDVPFDFLISPTKVAAETDASTGEELWILEALACTSDVDLGDDVILPIAIKNSESDLLEYSTVLENHDTDKRVGKIIDSRAIDVGLWVKIMISKTVPAVWQQVQEGVLSKLSIRGRILEVIKHSVNGKPVRGIQKMKLVETSLVSVPMNVKARALRWYVSKALDSVMWDKITPEGGENMQRNPRDETTPLPAEILKEAVVVENLIVLPAVEQKSLPIAGERNVEIPPEVNLAARPDVETRSVLHKETPDPNDAPAEEETPEEVLIEKVIKVPLVESVVEVTPSEIVKEKVLPAAEESAKAIAQTINVLKDALPHVIDKTSLPGEGLSVEMAKIAKDVVDLQNILVAVQQGLALAESVETLKQEIVGLRNRVEQTPLRKGIDTKQLPNALPTRDAILKELRASEEFKLSTAPEQLRMVLEVIAATISA